MPTDMNFADLFPRADEAQWRALVSRVLKGAPFERLVSKTADGVEIQPLYPPAKSESPRALRATAGGWKIAARVDHPDPVEANALLRTDLEGGANAVHLVFEGSPCAHGFGLKPTREAVETALDGVALDGVPVFFDAGDSAPADFATDVRVADGRAIHAAGGTEAQELAFVLSSVLEHWRALERAGVDADKAREKLLFCLAADADQFLTIGKFRALRQLWARVEEASGLAPRAIGIHAETAWRMMTRRDPAVNLLRATIASFSAGIGGADVISVLPWTQAIGLPDAHARRLARNTQLILLEECNLGHVADPAAGAGVFEAMTASLCDKAWTLMQEIESAGGRAAAIQKGDFAASVARAKSARKKLIATRRAPITGVSEFPLLDELRPDVLAPAPRAAAAGPFAKMRDAEDFEALRDRGDERLARTGARGKIFLANLGALADFSARAGFAKNLFEAGGFEAPMNDGFADDKALAAGFEASGASIACLCASDETYVARVESAARSLAARGAKQIWLAGRPGENETRWRAAGVTGFVFAGCDAIDALGRAWEAA